VKIDVFTIFPEMLAGYLSWSLIGRARAQGLIDISVHDIRSFSGDARRSVDGKPFGGGAGMVMLPEPVFEAVEGGRCTRPLFLLSPSGKVFDQAMATEMAHLGSSVDGGFSLLCGRYEGVDQRVADHLVDGEISVGDYVISGGELAALIVIEATCRLVPGVMGNDASVTEESFNDGLLEYPQYSHPRSFRGWEVPSVLLSGDHGRIASWRKAWQLKLTIERRPDLIEARGGVTPEERELLASLDSGFFGQ
jgi:tRNA (guanine37-N1)-methyltransferase